MTFHVASAYLEHPDGRHELVGTFQPYRLDEGHRFLNVAQRFIRPFIAGAPMAEDEVVRARPFPVVPMREDGTGTRFMALRVAPGDPVTWLRGWTWSDPHLARRWRT